MKMPRYLLILLLGLGIVGSTTLALSAQDESATIALAKSEGFWKSLEADPDGEEQLSYEWHFYVDELDTVVHWSARVGVDSKEILEVGIGHFGVRGNPGHVKGIFFSSTGLTAEVLGTVTDNGMLGHGHGTLPGGQPIAADLSWKFDSENSFTSSFIQTIDPKGYSEEGYSKTLQKLDYSSFQDFVEGEGISFPGDAEPAAGLAPLANLLGRWQVLDDEGQSQLTVNYRYRLKKRWLFERWRFAGGQTGVNISGIDPASGRLTLWSVGRNYIGRAGRWDVLSANSLGQVQGRVRLVREFSAPDTFAAHWQDVRDGVFVDREDGGYVAKRVGRSPQRQPSQVVDDSTRAAWLELTEASAEAYAQVEGTWERPLKMGDQEGRAVKSHYAGKTSVSYHNPDGKLVRKHTSEYKLKTVGDVSIFVHFNHKTVTGRQGLRRHDIARYVCRVQGDRFVEVHGVLDEQRGAPRMLVWNRIDSPESAAGQATAAAVRVSSSSNAKPSSAEASTASDKVYATVGFMEVPEGGEELYRQVESVWKKIHQARKDAGIIRDWALLKVQRGSQRRSPYQYVTFTVADSVEKLNSYDGIRVDFSPEEREIRSKTGQARRMLGFDVWELEMSALPSRGPRNAAPNFTIGFMKSKDEAKHLALEKDVYRNVWREHAKSGHIWNWSIWRRHSGQGLHARKPPFNMISVLSFPKNGRSTGLSRGARSQAAQAAFPDDSPEQLQRRLAQAGDVRDMYAFETWTVADSTIASDEKSQDKAVAASKWQDEEWTKLAGTWRAALPNGGYRVKRIDEGKETLEVYDADGGLSRKTQAEMTLDRTEGINFFTVRNWRPVGSEERAARPGLSYTSIYKVHKGKWYEQLRGIFAETENLRPDQFLIYEKVND